MMAVLVKVADALAALAKAHLGAEAEVRRAWRPLLDLMGLEGLQVTAIPKGLGVERLDRGHDVVEVRVDLVVQKRLENDDEAEIDALVAAAEGLAAALRFRRLETDPPALVVRADLEPVIDAEALEERRQFAAVIGVAARAAI